MAATRLRSPENRSLRDKLETAQARLIHLDQACRMVELTTGRQIPALARLAGFVRSQVTACQETLGECYRLNEAMAPARYERADADEETLTPSVYPD